MAGPDTEQVVDEVLEVGDRTLRVTCVSMGNPHCVIPVESLDATDLKALQAAVGGLIEIVGTNDGRLLVLDEEGKLKNKPINEAATALARGVIADTDYIVGDAVVVTDTEVF